MLHATNNNENNNYMLLYTNSNGISKQINEKICMKNCMKLNENEWEQQEEERGKKKKKN